MKQIERVYVAGPLNADSCGYIKNIHKMIKWAEKIRKVGFCVFVPGVDFLCGVVHGDWEYADYFENSQAWLKVADALFVCPGWENSKGTQKEIITAIELKIPVFYTLSALIEVKRRRENV